jgi:hypothetical protein
MFQITTPLLVVSHPDKSTLPNPAHIDEPVEFHDTEVQGKTNTRLLPPEGDPFKRNDSANGNDSHQTMNIPSLG